MTQTHSFKHILGRAMLVSGVALLCFATAAEAGFEWRGPLEPPVKAAPAPAAAQPEGMTGLEPVISWDGKTAGGMTDNMAMPADPAMPVESAPVDVLPAAPSPALAPFVAQTPLEPPVETGDVVAGFGSDLPLAIALQQVVPPGHQFSFAEGVNPGVKVSWEGGKPWKTVLSDMLARQGLGYRLQDNIVVIGYFPSDPAPAAAAPVAAQAPAPVLLAPAAEPVAQEIVTPDIPPAADAAQTVGAGEPVTIRRQRPSSRTQRTSGDVPRATAPAAIEWEAPDNNRTATMASTQAMSYPPEKSSTAPVPVTSAPPAALRQTAPPAYTPESLTAPPPMEAQAMSPMPLDEAPASVAAPVQQETPQEAVAAAMQEPAAENAVAPAAYKVWNGKKGQTLRDTLKSWSDSAGVDLYWSIDYDYRLKEDVGYDGSYDQAVAALLDQFAAVRPQPYGQLHQSQDGPRVLVVKSYDLTP